MLRFLYSTVPGRLLLKPLTARGFSDMIGRFMDSRFSRPLIPVFLRKYGIDLSDYEPQRYRSFNSFFTRRILPERRPFDPAPDHLVSPCDGRLSAFRIDESSRFRIKNSLYSAADLLGKDAAAEQFRGGTCLIFRLCVDDYHRYHFFDSGVREKSRFIPGVLHTVRPVALEHTDVFIQNCREYTLLHTEHFGPVAQIEIGAMLVGRISNRQGPSAFRRGEEKGLFLYGGSTVVLLFRKDAIRLDGDLISRSKDGTELRVLCGQRIGTALRPENA